MKFAMSIAALALSLMSGLSHGQAVAPAAYPDHAIRRRRPDEAAFLQTFGIERHAKTVMPEHFYQVAPCTSKNIEIAGMRVAAQRLLNLQRQPRHPAAHVGSSYR